MNNIIKKLLKAFITPISMLFRVKKNKILFKTLNNKYNCNQKYLIEYLHKNYKNDFETVFVTDKKSTQIYLNSKGIQTCKILSLKYFFDMFTAKFIVVNHNLPEYLPKKRSQILINTWHGGGSYKRLIDNHTTPLEYDKIDKFVSSCSSFSVHNLKEDFFIKDKQLLEIGMPRNDIFFTKTNKIAEKTKEALGIEKSNKIILYAPTFRASHKKEHLSNDFKKIINACESKFGGKFVFVNRDHDFSLDNNADEKNEDFVYEASAIEDTQELICAADIVITDYSSIMWDASFSKAPCFIYAYDLDDYYKIWDFYTPIKEWPYPIGKTIDELVNKILNFDYDEYIKNVNEHHLKLGSFENGTACKQLVDYMLNIKNTESIG